MSRNFYIADWHYGHENILAFDNRPFKTVDEMNEQLIDRWNQVVDRGDKVYVLGDMFWKKVDVALEVLDKFKRKFTKICDYDEIDDCGRKVVLCHYPITCFKNHFYGWYHLYGHVHISFESRMVEHDRYLMENLYNHQCNMYNVGAMMPWIDYTPRTLDEIIGGYNEQRTKTRLVEESETGRDE